VGQSGEVRRHQGGVIRATPAKYSVTSVPRINPSRRATNAARPRLRALEKAGFMCVAVGFALPATTARRRPVKSWSGAGLGPSDFISNKPLENRLPGAQPGNRIRLIEVLPLFLLYGGYFVTCGGLQGTPRSFSVP